MVVVFPAPFGPSRPKHSPALDFEVQAAHGLNFAVVGLAQVAALDGGGHWVILLDVVFLRCLGRSVAHRTLLGLGRQ